MKRGLGISRIFPFKLSLMRLTLFTYFLISLCVHKKISIFFFFFPVVFPFCYCPLNGFMIDLCKIKHILNSFTFRFSSFLFLYYNIEAVICILIKQYVKRLTVYKNSNSSHIKHIYILYTNIDEL